MDLLSAYGDTAISPDGATLGIYGLWGFAYSANLLGPSLIFDGVPFFFGPPSGWNCVAQAFGLTIPLPAGQFGSLQMLATGVNGNQPGQDFTVAYSDGTTDTFTQSFSAMLGPQNYPGETVAATMPYYNYGPGSRVNSPAYLYGYSFILRNQKTVASVTLPRNSQLRVLAMTLVPTAFANVSDYILTASPSSVPIGQGQSGTSTITVNPLGGFSGSVTLTVSGLPTGVTASFSPVNSAQGSVLTFTASNTAAPGAATVVVTGRWGSLSKTVGLTLTVGTSRFVDMSAAYDANGIYTDGTTFTVTGGLDRAGNAYSATLLGPAITWNGSLLAFGPPNAPDAVTSTTIPLPAGRYARLDMLGTGMYGDQLAVFTVTYTDGTKSLFTQSLSDWVGGRADQNFNGESVAVTMAYRVTCGGAESPGPVFLYGYSFDLDATKTVSSVTLPANNANVDVLAMALMTVLAPTTTTLTADVNPQIEGSNVTFSAQVAPASGGGTPTGTVTFYDGPMQLGHTSLDGGKATYTSSSLTVGRHSITTFYWGDNRFASSMSSAVSEVVTAVSLSPTSLNFGAQLVGSSSTKTVTLTNLGSTPLSISSLSVVSFAPLIIPTRTKPEDFTIESGSCAAGGSVAGLGSCTINLAFRPTAVGVRSATLVIVDSDPSSPQTVNLRGTGTAAPAPATSPGFGPQHADTTSAP